MFRFFTASITPRALILLSCVATTPAHAAPASDFFGHNTNNSGAIKPSRVTPAMQQAANAPKIGAGPLAMMSSDKPIVHWFEAYDRAIADAKPTPTEQLILSRPLNQELERVQAMIKTSGVIAKRYRALAKRLRAMPVQADWPQVKELRDGQADFYEQEASVYEEMIKPRPPSKTKEELDARLKDLTDRSTAAKTYGTTLLSMDLDIQLVFTWHVTKTIWLNMSWALKSKGITFSQNDQSF